MKWKKRRRRRRKLGQSSYLDKFVLLCWSLGDEVSLTPESSPELTKRSWFGTLMGSERDETYTILVKGKPLASVKADLIHAFLSVNKLKSQRNEPITEIDFLFRSQI